MSKERYLLHELIAAKLNTVMFNIGKNLTDFEAGKLFILLEMLRDGQMPISAAKKIAEDLADLPRLLEQATAGSVWSFSWSGLAKMTLNDLAHRGEEASAPPPSPTPNPLKPEDTAFHRE